MAARSHARPKSSTTGAPFYLFIYLLTYVLALQLVGKCSANNIYTRQDLLEVGRQPNHVVLAEFIDHHRIPNAIARRPGDEWFPLPGLKRKRRRRERKQPRGRRGGLRHKLRSKPYAPAVPSLFLANARSLVNKMDELRLLDASCNNVKNSCALIFSETWFRDDVTETAAELEGRSLFRADRDRIQSGKERGGGVAIYTKDSWCRNTKIVSSFCSPELEYISIKCRPFYLPREFNCVFITATYIPPDANASMALTKLHDCISKQLNSEPDAVHIVAGDFNHADLKSVLPKFYQHVKCATREEKTLDKVYTNIKLAYKANALAHIGKSDHMPVLLLPAYTPVRLKDPIITKTVTTWPANSTPSLQLSLHDTRWEEYEHSDLERFTSSSLQHIRSCMNAVTVEKRVKIYPNTKPWMTTKVKGLLKERDSAFRSGDKELYNSARSNLNLGIKEAKAEYKDKIEGHFLSNDSKRVWQGVQHMTNYKASRRSADGGDPQLADELNSFYARFEVEVEPAAAAAPTLPHLPATNTLVLSEHDVRRTLKGVDPRKAAGPDGIPGRVLRDCADQLAPVLTKIFNESLTQASVPTCLKTSTIIPVPKNNTVSCLNDYRPVALTPIIMKCFEKLVRAHIVSALPTGLDPYQFAYRANRSTEDAIATALHSTLTHLEKRNSYVRLLFVDFSSAFNTILPDKLVQKLCQLGLPPPTCNWIMDFLSNRPQSVRVGPHTSTTLTLSTGSPQGCVLSPLLYSLYTHDFTPAHPSNSIIKFADDTTVVGLIHRGNETKYRDEVEQLAERCKANNLLLNQKKTQEIIVDFRRKKKGTAPPLLIEGGCVERVASFRFLGVHIQEDLSWGTNTKAIIKKAQQRLYFLRVLKKYHPRRELLVSFYRSTVESILTYCIGVWFSSCTVAERLALQRVVKTAQRIIGCPLPSLEDIYSTRCHRKATKIRNDPHHPGHRHFATMRSGWRLRALPTKTNRLKHSFYHRSIQTMNTARKR